MQAEHAKPKAQQKRIAVKPDTLPNLMASVANGEYRIPQFQRTFVWKRSKVIDLFDSIYKEFPIGSFFVWKAGQEHNDLFRHTVGLDLPPVGEHDNVSFILDGQQRITSLYVVLNGMTVRQNDKLVDYSLYCLDLRDEKFTRRKPDNKRYVALCSLWGPDAMALTQEIPPEYRAAYIRCWQTLQTYPISIVEVSDKDLPEVCRIFRRINQSGQRLDRFDLVSAMTFSPEFDLRERLDKDLQDRLKRKNFGAISPTIVTQLLALIEKGQCTERNEYALTSKQIRRHWKAAVDAVLLAADTLRKNMGVANYSYLPYDAQLTLLSYYFAKRPDHAPPAAHMDWLRDWFWRSAFGQRYSAGGATRVGQDARLVADLAGGGEPEFKLAVPLDVADLVRTRMTWTASAVRNAYLCLLSNLGPLHLGNNSPLDLVNGGISDFTSGEKHHIFPRSLLSKAGAKDADIHVLPNFCFLPMELNRRISNSAPSEYIPRVQAENPDFEKAARSHLLPVNTGDWIAEDDYEAFLEARAEMILDEVARLCGGLATPREDERQETIRKLEERLRDLIAQTLGDSFGSKYWKSHVPEAVRSAIEMRISQAIEREPELQAADFTDPRRRMDYCNVMEYLTIIENGSNWPEFEPLFRNKAKLQHHFGALNQYRNAVMHNRPMEKLTESEGKTGLVWFAAVLPEDEPESQTDLEGDTEDETDEE